MTSIALPLLARPAPGALLGAADAAGRWPCPSPWHPPGRGEPSVLAGAPASTWWCVTCGDGGGVRDLALLLAAGDVGRARELFARAAATSVVPPTAGPVARPGTSTTGGATTALELVVQLRGADPATGAGAVDEEVAVDGLPAGATVGELAAALGHAAAAGLVVDGRWWPASTALAATGIGRGSTVGAVPSSPLPPAAPAPTPPETVEPAAPVVHVAAVAGTAGGLVGLTPGRHLVGTSLVVVAPDGTTEVHALRPGDDPAAAALEVRRGPPPSDAPVVTAAGVSPWTRSVNRPPRPAPSPEVASPPPAPVAAGDGSRPAWGTLVPAVVSVAGAALGALLLRQPLFLLLSLVGALATVAAHAQGRSAARRDRARRTRRHAAEVAHWWQAVAAAHAAARARARDVDEVADAVARVRARSARLWERRPQHPDAFTVSLGRGDVPWIHRPGPPAAPPGPPAAPPWPAPPLVDVLADVPVLLTLAPGTVVGVVGPRAAARALARAVVVQLVAQHGPADLALAVVAEHDRAWQWADWLPHAVGPVAIGAVAADRLLGGVLAGDRSADRVLALVVDGGGLAAARTSLVRAALAGRHGPVAGVVIVDAPHELPAVCTHTVHLTADGRAVVRDVVSPDGAVGQCFTPAGLAPATALEVARRLAPFDDPEQHDRTAGLPARVGLGELLAAGRLDADAVAAAWAAAGPDPSPRTPIGVAVDGTVELDLERDGPHALVVGTTGAGKSELLRTLVVGLAVHAPPASVTFLLVDYKGGAAFDACASLPHVVGVVTDLDEALAERALRSLEAELRRREQRLRAAGAADLHAFRAAPAGAGQPLPRLVVVVDEFATLAAELPGFLSALVGVAQRGRSLGVHLVLATQRPGASLSDDIRANTNLRIALRVPDGATSVDVVGDPVAASFDRSCPGRAAVRLGPGELLTVQTASTALATGVVGRPRARSRHAHPVVPVPGASDADELSVLAGAVDAVRAAHERSGSPLPARPWLEPLPTELAFDAVPAGSVGLVDDPDTPCHRPLRWAPTDGVLAVLGPAASVSAALTTVAADALRRAAGEGTGRHVYALVADPEPWRDLAVHPDIRVVALGDRERVERLVGALAASDGPDAPDRPPALVVVDGLGALRESLGDDMVGERTWQTVVRYLGGPRVEAAVGVERVGAVPGALAPRLTRRWVAVGTDPADAVLWGVARAAGVPAGPSPVGRIVEVGTGLEGQVAWGEPRTLPATTTSVAPFAADPLPAIASGPALPAGVWRDDGAWLLPVGLLDGVVPRPAVLRVPPGEAVLVAAPARGGASTALAAVAHQVRAAAPDLPVLVVASRRGPPPGLDAVAAVLGPHEPLDAVTWPAGPFVLLVDDADTVDEHGAVLPALLRRPDVLVVAAGRPEALRAAYGSWLTLVRRSRLGLLLRPDPDLDGDLLGTVLPRRRAGAWPAGRGYLVDDDGPHVVQVATWATRVSPQVTRPPPDQVLHP